MSDNTAAVVFIIIFGLSLGRPARAEERGAEEWLSVFDDMSRCSGSLNSIVESNETYPHDLALNLSRLYFVCLFNPEQCRNRPLLKLPLLIGMVCGKLCWKIC